MQDHEEFLWTGLRARLERNGTLRPHTTGSAAIGPRPKRRRPANGALKAIPLARVR